MDNGGFDDVWHDSRHVDLACSNLYRRLYIKLQHRVPVSINTGLHSSTTSVASTLDQMNPPLERQNPNDADLHHEPATTIDMDMRSRDANNERLISVLQGCFADLVKKNEEQMDK
ncbi:hypothetical protein C8R44DRAFT_886105 [Mycena epipterygia]|nr:hypothetical protein C8R44DRAFT_886105 [Mycena epipterygia]